MLFRLENDSALLWLEGCRELARDALQRRAGSATFSW